MKADLLIDSGVYRTVLTEEQWKQIQPEGANRMPKLNKSTVRLMPYGTDKTLEMLGRSRCQIKAGTGAEIITTVYMVRGANESLLGLRD